MIQLTFKGKDFNPNYDFRLYKNIVGSDKKKQDENFSNFIQGLCADNPDTLVEFGVAMSGGTIADVDVADQFGEKGLFDDVVGACNEIIQGFLSNGFLAAKVKMLLNSENASIERMRSVQENTSLTDSDKQDLQLAIQNQELTHEEHVKKLSKSKANK